MSKFKVGDRVEFVEDHTKDAYKGAGGTVTYVDAWHLDGVNQLLDIELDSGEEATTYDFRVKHVEATPIPSDFRFFRRTDGAISEVPYPTFEAALEGWRGFAQDGDQTEIVELIPHGTYKATLKIEEA